MPAGFGKLFRPTVDWNFTTAKQAAAVRPRALWPRGRMLGGSSSINAQMWVRGHRADYDGWGVARLVLRRGPAVLPAGSSAASAPTDGGVYGTRGPVHVEELRTPNPPPRRSSRRAGSWGSPALAELNGPSNEGCSQTPVTQNRGRRCSSADAYLRPAAKRPNLTVLTSSHVHGILVADRAARSA